MLILGRVSHLDAFSGYPCPTSLTGVATGMTAGTRAVRPTRSSRTKVGLPQHSLAHYGYRPNCLTTLWTELMCHYNRRTAGPLRPSPTPRCDKPTSTFQITPAISPL